MKAASYLIGWLKLKSFLSAENIIFVHFPYILFISLIKTYECFWLFASKAEHCLPHWKHIGPTVERELLLAFV